MRGDLLHNPDMRVFVLLIFVLLAFPSCTPIGAAIGAGATLGISSAREGGIKSTASDLKIRTLINDKWFKYDLDTFLKLKLTINQGRVLVTGIVQNPDHRVEAIRLVWQVDGIYQVINEIRVADGEGLPGYVRDKWITTRLRTEMTFDRDIQSINYSIDTVAGTVYLMGVAQNQVELNKVIERARVLPHVMQVISYVKMAGEPVQPYNNDAQSQQGYGQAAMQDEWGEQAAQNENPYSYSSAPAPVESEEILWKR